jgi:hypothetical protein
MKQAILIILLFTATTVDAHGVRWESISPNAVRFCYDDGSPMARGYITVYDGNAEEMATETADADGVFDYSTYRNAVRISCADVHGHCVSFSPDGKPMPHQTQNAVIVLIVVILLCAAAFYFERRRRWKVNVSNSEESKTD